MADLINSKRKKKLGLGFRCCSSGIPSSPENNPKSPCRKPDHSKRNQVFFPNPPNNNKLGLGLIERYRICSPGRVSPIDSETNSEQAPPESLPENIPIPEPLPEPVKAPTSSFRSEGFFGDVKKKGFCDVKLSLKGKNGDCLVLDLHSDVLSANSSFFAMKLLDSRQVSERFRIDVSDVTDLEVYKSVIELMYAENVARHLMRAGVSRSIDILEVSLFQVDKHQKEFNSIYKSSSAVPDRLKLLRFSTINRPLSLQYQHFASESKFAIPEKSSEFL